MRNILPTILLVIILLLVGCHSDRRQLALLNRAEAVMLSAPDTALALLDSINSQRLVRADNARYALLMSQALDKNYIDATNDSLINIAVQYYKHSNNDRYKGMAYYYLSRICENGGRYEDAIANSILAEVALRHTDDYYMLALVLGNRGDIYAEQYNIDEALDLKRQAIAFYEMCNNKKIAAYTHLRMSSLFKINHPADSVLHHLDIAQQIGYEMNNEEILYIVENYRASFYDYAKEYDKAIATLRNAIKQYPSHKPNADDYFLLCRIYYNIGKPDSALYYLDNFVAPLAQTYSDKETIYIFRSNIYQQKQDYVNAHKYYRDYTNSIIKSGMMEQDKSIKELEKKYHTQLLKQESEALKTRNILLSVVLSLVIIIAFIFAYLCYRQRQMRITQYYQLHESAQHEIGAIQSQYDAIKKQLDAQLSQQQLYRNELQARIDTLRTLSSMTDTYAGNKEKFYDKCRSYINMCEHTEDSFVRDIRTIASLYCEGFVDTIQSLSDDLSDEDINLAILILLGFDNSQIRILFNHSHAHSIYNKRGRLRKKLGLDNNVEIETFLQSLIKKDTNH